MGTGGSSTGGGRSGSGLTGGLPGGDGFPGWPPMGRSTAIDVQGQHPSGAGVPAAACASSSFSWANRFNHRASSSRAFSTSVPVGPAPAAARGEDAREAVEHLRQRQRLVGGDAALGHRGGDRGDRAGEIARIGDFRQSQFDRLAAPHAEDAAETEAHRDGVAVERHFDVVLYQLTATLPSGLWLIAPAAPLRNAGAQIGWGGPI
jgi:hypothetical protein